MIAGSTRNLWSLGGQLVALAVLATTGVVASACNSSDPVEDDETTSSTTAGQSGVPFFSRLVQVTLDGQPIAGATVMQGGGQRKWVTAADGTAEVIIDTSIRGEWQIVGSHPSARTQIRTGAKPVTPNEEGFVEIALVSVQPGDNEAYEFQQPGTPELWESTKYCSHCHMTITRGWFDSAHRSSASNPAVHDLFVGVASAADSQADCDVIGGRWDKGPAPGTSGAAMRCYVGSSVLSDLNPDGSAPDQPQFGACADCHAPGINGRVGGRSLLEAVGVAYDYGVHCDVCHKVEHVDMTAPAGVAGRLRIQRPMEPALTLPWLPLSFGPYYDVPTAAMGAVPRDHFRQSDFCGGCHQLDQAVLTPGAAIDVNRWPDGRLPIHSTFNEWRDDYAQPQTSCSLCHMTQALDVTNSGDLQVIEGTNPDLDPSAVVGWERVPGEVRNHEWKGPRTSEWAALGGVVSVTVDKTVDNDELVVAATIENVGAGHAVPTGEPMRSAILSVSASCDGVALEAIGGDVIPDFGGTRDQKPAGEDWGIWPNARAGDIVRVVQRHNSWHDYSGHGPFGDGRFSPEQKGMAVETFVGSSVVTFVGEGGAVVLNAPLPAGDIAYLGDAIGAGHASALAGAPGFGFARVLVDTQGRRMVPHFLATDVASDNRLLPGKPWTSHHRFRTTCNTPQVRTRVTLRAFPQRLASERGWTRREVSLVDRAD